MFIAPITSEVRTTCPYCGVGCGVLASPGATGQSHAATLAWRGRVGSPLGDPGWGDSDAACAETLSPPPGPLKRADLPPPGGGDRRHPIRDCLATRGSEEAANAMTLQWGAVHSIITLRPELSWRQPESQVRTAMLDKSADAGAHATKARPALDFQAHLADLEARGLLVRIDRPIDKDTELHPLVRWQVLGGIPEYKRRAFLFTNVIDRRGRRYDFPVAVGALAASPAIYAVGMGQPVANIGQAWMKAIANPIPPVEVTSAPCQEVVLSGDDLRRPGGGLAKLPVPVSTPGFDAAPYLTATLCITRDPDSGILNMGMYRAARKPTDALAGAKG